MAETLSLPAELTIYTVTEQRARWLAWLAQATRERASGRSADDVCCVDATAVAEVDGAGLQLLLALARELAQAQWPLRLVRPSAGLAQACAALGVADALGCAAAPGAAR
jgi:ABC-type transporter Mla MlaB component